MDYRKFLSGHGGIVTVPDSFKHSEMAWYEMEKPDLSTCPPFGKESMPVVRKLMKAWIRIEKHIISRHWFYVVDLLPCQYSPRKVRKRVFMISESMGFPDNTEVMEELIQELGLE